MSHKIKAKILKKPLIVSHFNELDWKNINHDTNVNIFYAVKANKATINFPDIGVFI